MDIPDEHAGYGFDRVSFSIFALSEILSASYAFSTTGREDFFPQPPLGKRCIYCFWHAHILPVLYRFRHTGKHMIVSESTDGKRLAAILRKWGYGIVHGSSTRGGAMAKQKSVDLLKENQCVLITPDGPRGPREVAKKGVAQIALLADAVVVPCAALPSAAWRLNSWDRFMIPYPLAHIDIRFRDPIDPADFGSRPDPEASLLEAIQEGLS